MKKATTLHQQCPDIFLSLAVAVAGAVTDAAIVVVLDVVDVFALLMIQLAKKQTTQSQTLLFEDETKNTKKSSELSFFSSKLVGRKIVS